MKRLLTADWHLTDTPLENYRWDVFTRLKETCAKYPDIKEIHILGDITDRKDRHTGALVNRMLDELTEVNNETGCNIVILMGNHDAPLNGSPYWKFLRSEWIHYVVTPELHDASIWLLPFSANPLKEWAHLDLSVGKALFIHQTVEGSIIEGGRVIPKDVQPMPHLPEGVDIYAGDVHKPQFIEKNRVTYVGAPHPVRFGENWSNRFIILQDDIAIGCNEVWIPSIKRIIIDGKEALTSAAIIPGDQIRIRYPLLADELTTWPEREEEIRSWVRLCGATLVSLEVTLEALTPKMPDVSEVESIISPKELLRQYCENEMLDETVSGMGAEILGVACSS